MVPSSGIGLAVNDNYAELSCINTLSLSLSRSLSIDFFSTGEER